MNNYIEKIKIINVMHLKGIDIPLDNGQLKHLILTGKNGAGKTSVAKAIASDVSALFYGRAGNDPKMNVKAEFLFGNTHNLFHAGKFLFKNFPALRKLDPKPLNLARVTSEGASDRKAIQGEHLLDFLFSLNYEKLELQSRGETETTTYIGITNWFVAWEKTLRDVFEDKELKFEFDIKNKKYWIRQGEKQFDFNTLSDGYSSILAIIVELILAMGNSRNEIYDMPGVVIIDEIDIHLHLSLQKLVLPMLTTFFPKIQFIVTTHSPFVLMSIDNAVIYDLERKILIADGLEGASYEGIVEAYFETPEYAKEVYALIAEYETLIKNAPSRTDESYGKLLEIREKIAEMIKVPWLSKELESTFLLLENMREQKFEKRA